MAWFPPVTFIVGTIVTHSILNIYLRNDVDIFALHVHDSVGPVGENTLGPLVSMTFIDAAVPGTPALGVGTHTRVFTTATLLGLRSGSVAGSAARYISNTTHTHGGF